MKRWVVLSPDGSPRRAFFFRWFARDYAAWCAQTEMRYVGTAGVYEVRRAAR